MATADDNNNSKATWNRRDATEEEIRTLPHIIDEIPAAVWIAQFIGAAERFTYYGITAPWRETRQPSFKEIDFD